MPTPSYHPPPRTWHSARTRSSAGWDTRWWSCVYAARRGALITWWEDEVRTWSPARVADYLCTWMKINDQQLEVQTAKVQPAPSMDDLGGDGAHMHAASMGPPCRACS
jgi:hypothetical protein